MKKKFVQAHMKVAFIYANLSYCERKQVGCVIVKNDRIISIGFNGTPPGWDNYCETEEGLTKPEVFHAEANAVAKLARCNESGEDALCFVTCAPCLHCAKLLVQTGISKVFYSEEYRGTEGLDFLTSCNIDVEKVLVED